MKKILIVDDEPDVTFLVKEMLGREGFKVVEANNGEEAISKIEKEKPDLVLLDIMMPEMNGWEVSRKIKKNNKTKDTLVSMYSVKFGDEDKVKTFDYGLADWHIKKSMNQRKLVNTVNWLLTSPLKRFSYSV